MVIDSSKYKCTEWWKEFPPLLLSHPCVNFDLHRFYKDNTAPDIYWSMFYEICASYDNFDHIYTDGLKMGDRVFFSPLSYFEHSCLSKRWRWLTELLVFFPANIVPHILSVAAPITWHVDLSVTSS